MPIFLMVLQALAMLPTMIDGYEKVFSGKKKSGKTKKKLLMDTTKAALDIAKATPEEQEVVLNTVSIVTDATVAAMNAASNLGENT